MSELNRRAMMTGAGLAGAAGVGLVAAQNAIGQDGNKQKGGVLDQKEMSELRFWDTPTVANALERRDLEQIHQQNRLEGVMTPKIRCMFPELGIMNGYAATATIQASKPRDGSGSYVGGHEYWKYIDSLPKPTFMVIHDLDAPNPVGSYWGEVNANIHRALGCVGVITDGGVRDMPIVKALGFGFFAAEVLVSHAYVHLVDYGKPVTVGGVTVNSGDLLQADEHGVIKVPSSVAPKVADNCYAAFMGERKMVQYCQQPGINLQKMLEYGR